MKTKRMSMMTIGMVVALCALTAVTSLPPAAGGALQAASAPAWKIQDLAWMAGSWQTAPGRMQSEEHWTKPAAGTMFAVSRTIAGDRTVFHEFLRIEARPDGLYYVAMPKGGKETPFKLTSLEGQKAVFENPEHDHPQKISYWKNADGTMTARVEGDKAGKAKPQDFVFKPM